MSYDPTTFLGLAAGGSTYAPPGSHAVYTATISALDSEGQFGGGNTYRCDPAPGDTLHTFVDCPALDLSGLPVSRSLSELAAGGDNFADLPTPPDFVEVYVSCRGDDENALSNVHEYATTCSLGLFGPACDGFIASHYYLDFLNASASDPGTLIPIDGLTDPLDGTDRAIEGYLQPASAVYSGDTGNTASSLLWRPEDIGQLTIKVRAPDAPPTLFHSATVAQPGGLVFTVYPFWLVNQSFVCLV